MLTHSLGDAARAHRASPDVSCAELLDALVNGRGLSAVVPVTLDVVERDLLATGGCFPGDLVRGLMEVPGGFWSRHPPLYDRYQAVLRAAASARRRMPAEQRMAFWAPLPARASACDA